MDLLHRPLLPKMSAAMVLQRIFASHNGRDPLRREAFLLKQSKGLELWRGLVVHSTIESQIVPRLREGSSIPWEEVISSSIALAHKQFEFSASGQYRQPGMTKAQAGDAYCVLQPHMSGQEITKNELAGVLGEIEKALRNLSQLEGLWQKISGRGKYWPEITVFLKYAGFHVQTKLDLLCFRDYGKPIVVEWKTYAQDNPDDAKSQTALYAWALCRCGKWGVKTAEDVEILEAQLLTGKLVEHHIDAEDFDEVEDRILTCTEEMRALVGDGQFGELQLEDFAFAQSAFSCAYCPFRNLCLETVSDRAMSNTEPIASSQGLLF